VSAYAQKSAVLACLTMAKLKINQHVPNKNEDLLKKNQLNGNRACNSADVLFTTLIENLRFCSSAKAGIVLNLFLNFEQK